jgi:hypothetical protein
MARSCFGINEVLFVKKWLDQYRFEFWLEKNSIKLHKETLRIPILINLDLESSSLRELNT